MAYAGWGQCTDVRLSDIRTEDDITSRCFDAAARQQGAEGVHGVEVSGDELSLGEGELFW
jgi:hypothetical protein